MAWNPTNDEERPWMTNAVSEVRYPKQGTTNVTPNQGGTVEGTDTVWGIDSNGEVYGWQGGEPVGNMQGSPFTQQNGL